MLYVTDFRFCLSRGVIPDRVDPTSYFWLWGLDYAILLPPSVSAGGRPQDTEIHGYRGRFSGHLHVGGGLTVDQRISSGSGSSSSSGSGSGSSSGSSSRGEGDGHDHHRVWRGGAGGRQQSVSALACFLVFHNPRRPPGAAAPRAGCYRIRWMKPFVAIRIGELRCLGLGLGCSCSLCGAVSDRVRPHPD